MYREYSTVEDFVLDPTFKSWVLGNDHEANLKWESFMLQNPEKSPLVNQAKELLMELEELKNSSSEISISPQSKKLLWKEIQSNLPSNGMGVSQKNSESNDYTRTVNFEDFPARRKSRSIYYYLAAACLVVFMIAGGVFYSSLQNPESSQSIEPVWLTNATPPGIKSSFKLPDGSVVFLNAGSSIRFREGLAGSIREIFLEGEAFFEVEKDTIRPFLVHSGNLTTQALGTSFNIRNYNQKPVEIALVTGKVRVESQDHSYQQILIPGEGVSESNGTLVKSLVDLENTTSWMYKTIVFESEEFLDAIAELENWFGVKISILNIPQNPSTISAKYVNESLENILYGLSYKMDFEYSINGSQVEINFNPKK